MNAPVVPTIEEIVAKAGIKWESARVRLQKYEAGKLPLELLCATREEMLKTVLAEAGRKTGRHGTDEWLKLGNRPRPEGLAHIKGETDTERRMARADDLRGRKYKDLTALRKLVRETVGLSETAAATRVKRYLQGVATYEDLFRAKNPGNRWGKTPIGRWK